MTKHGKNYRNIAVKIEKEKRYAIGDAVKLVKETGNRKFDESVDVAINLGVDPRHAEQMIRGAVVLPHGIGKTVRVAVFARGQKATEAQEAGADIVGAEDLAEQISKNIMDFDKVIATPDMMVTVGKLGKILGPRGLMPNPKVGTVTMDVAKAVKEVKAGKIEFRVDKAGILHAPIGRVSFVEQNLADNLKVLLDEIVKVKPSSLKGQYIKKISISATMGPGVKIDHVSV